MRRVLIAILLIAILHPSAVAADAGLEIAVSAASLPRVHSDALHTIAHRRVSEYVTNRSHAPPPDTGEVLGWNRGYPWEGISPIQAIISGWLASGTHLAILLDPDYTTIGCAELVADDPLNEGIDQTHFFACLVGTPIWAEDPSLIGPFLIPNTAVH